MLHGSSGRGLGYLPEAILACRDLQPRIALLWALSCSTNAEGSPPASKSAGSHSQWEGDDYNDGLVIPRERAEAAVLLAIPSLLSCMLHERVALGEASTSRLSFNAACKIVRKVFNHASRKKGAVDRATFEGICMQVTLETVRARASPGRSICRAITALALCAAACILALLAHDVANQVLLLVLSVIAGIGITALCLHGFTSMDHALGMAMCGGRSSSSNDSMSVQPSESREQAGNRLKQIRALLCAPERDEAALCHMYCGLLGDELSTAAMKKAE